MVAFDMIFLTYCWLHLVAVSTCGKLSHSAYVVELCDQIKYIGTPEYVDSRLNAFEFVKFHPVFLRISM